MAKLCTHEQVCIEAVGAGQQLCKSIADHMGYRVADGHLLDA